MEQSERIVYQCDVDKLCRESFITHVWSRDSINIQQLKIWVLDAHICQTDLVLLVAGANPNVSPQIQYALATLSAFAAPSPPLAYSSFCVLKFATSLSDDVHAP